MKTSKKECPNCRGKLASKRNLRRDIVFESLVQTFYPDLKEQKQEEAVQIEKINQSVDRGALVKTFQEGLKRQKEVYEEDLKKKKRKKLNNNTNKSTEKAGRKKSKEKPTQSSSSSSPSLSKKEENLQVKLEGKLGGKLEERERNANEFQTVEEIPSKVQIQIEKLPTETRLASIPLKNVSLNSNSTLKVVALLIGKKLGLSLQEVSSKLLLSLSNWDECNSETSNSTSLLSNPSTSLLPNPSTFLLPNPSTSLLPNPSLPPKVVPQKTKIDQLLFSLWRRKDCPPKLFYHF